jgi:hypothetical protein
MNADSCQRLKLGRVQLKLQISFIFHNMSGKKWEALPFAFQAAQLQPETGAPFPHPTAQRRLLFLCGELNSKISLSLSLSSSMLRRSAGA